MSRHAYALTCPEPLAAAAGELIFARGGNAMDAAVAAAFAQAVVNPLMCGLGGDAFFCVYDPRTRETVMIEAPVTIGSLATPSVFEPLARGRAERVGRFLVEGDINQMGYGSIMVPGFVRGLGEGFRRHGSGRVTWQEVVAPAARLAGDGYAVDHVAARAWRSREPGPGVPDVFTKLHTTPEARQVYLKPDGGGYRVGDRITLPDLARTLERIGERGASEFYEGETGRRIARDMEANGGLFTWDDLRGYRVRERPPVWGSYRGLTLASCPPPGAGPTVIEMLRILEHSDQAALHWNGPAYLDLVARVLAAAFGDAAVWQGDPAVVEVPLEPWISREHAAEQYARILREMPGGAETPRAASADDSRGIPKGGMGRGTTHITAVDEDLLIVSLNTSTGSTGSSGVVTPGLGFLYNNFLGQFDPVPGRRQSIAPGKGSGGASSTIFFRDGRPVLATGAAGGSRLISAIVQSVVNMVDHGMTPAEAVAVPRIHAEEAGILFAEPGLDEVTAEALAARGWEVRTSTYMGRIAAVGIDPDARVLYPASDPRGGRGVAAGPPR
ncbi:MAG: gamma-glutamyltransferase [Armatimonadetes bacterium]|nr:gamma-glutamyltransferase [Armatimonadota bacterium]